MGCGDGFGSDSVKAEQALLLQHGRVLSPLMSLKVFFAEVLKVFVAEVLKVVLERFGEDADIHVDLVQHLWRKIHRRRWGSIRLWATYFGPCGACCTQCGSLHRFAFAARTCKYYRSSWVYAEHSLVYLFQERRDEETVHTVPLLRKPPMTLRVNPGLRCTNRWCNYLLIFECHCFKPGHQCLSCQAASSVGIHARCTVHQNQVSSRRPGWRRPRQQRPLYPICLCNMLTLCHGHYYSMVHTVHQRVPLRMIEAAQQKDRGEEGRRSVDCVESSSSVE